MTDLSKNDSGVRSWHFVLALLLCAMPVFLLPARRNDMNSMERLAILTAQETWIRQHHGESNAWLLPSLNEQPRLRKPPLTTWLYMAAWWDLTPESATPDQLIGRTHFVSGALGVLLFASCGWIGLTLGDRRVALLAVFAIGSMWFVERQARMASYDIHVAAWAALAVASGLWTMRPFGPRPRVARIVVGASVSIIAFWASWMSKNPLTLLYVLPALVMVPLLDSNRRWMNLVLIAIIAGVGGVLTQPWYWYVDSHVFEAPAIRALEYANLRPEYQGPFYYLALVGLVAPWSIWFVAGVINPWIRHQGVERRRAFIIWFWLIIVFVVMSAYPAKQQRYILSLTPAAALLCAMVFRDDQNEADAGALNRRAKIVSSVHWGSLLLASLVFGLTMTLTDRMIDWGWMRVAALEPLPWWAAAGITLLLVLVSVVGGLAHAKGRCVRAGILTGVWAIAMLSTVWWSWTTAPAATNPSWDPAMTVRGIVGDRPIFALNTPDSGEPLSETFRLYAIKRIPFVTPRELRDLRSAHPSEPVFVISLNNEDQPQAMESRGWQAVLRFDDEPGVHRVLWKPPS